MESVLDLDSDNISALSYLSEIASKMKLTNDQISFLRRLIEVESRNPAAEVIRYYKKLLKIYDAVRICDLHLSLGRRQERGRIYS